MLGIASTLAAEEIEINMSINRLELLHTLEYWIEYSARVIERASNELLIQHGITYRQVRVLAVLIVRGPISQAELAERIQVEPSTIVRVVNRMERDGWIDRKSDPVDKRRNMLVVTPMAETIWETILKCAGQVHVNAYEGITQERLESTIQTLSDICMNLSHDNPSTSDSIEEAQPE